MVLLRVTTRGIVTGIWRDLKLNIVPGEPIGIPF